MNSSKYIVVVSFVSSVSLLSVALSLEPLNPEETAFINTRCLEDYAANKQCLTKCILEKLGLYNPLTHKFEGELIKIQWNNYSDLVPVQDANAFADAVSKLPETNNTCAEVYAAYQPINKQHKLTYLNLFHENLENAKKIYDTLGTKIKQPGQSAFLFCEDKFYPLNSSNRADICEMRHFKVFDDETYKKRVQCVYKLLRYITKDDKFDPAELQRDFKLIGRDTEQLKNALEKCKSSEPKDALSLAHYYYKCLVDSDVVSNYMEAVNYREVRSMDYRYNIPEVRLYDKAAVTKQVKELDAKQCPDG